MSSLPGSWISLFCFLALPLPITLSWLTLPPYPSACHTLESSPTAHSHSHHHELWLLNGSQHSSPSCQLRPSLSFTCTTQQFSLNLQSNLPPICAPVLPWVIFLKHTYNPISPFLKNHCFFSTPKESILNSLTWLRVEKALCDLLPTSISSLTVATGPSASFYQSLNLKFPQYAMLLHAYVAFSWALPFASNDLPPFFHTDPLRPNSTSSQANTSWIPTAPHCFLSMLSKPFIQIVIVF